MKTAEINIRDPYVLVHQNKYYLYGTRSATTWGKAEGFDCYVSSDLKDWEGPHEIFKRPEGFWADQNYWAPECYYFQGKFYLLTTLGAKDRKKAVYIMAADKPEGPFSLYAKEPLTPWDWNSIDGSLYFDKQQPYLIFSHSFEDVPKGDMCAVALSADLREAKGTPRVLFSAAETPWATPIPFAKQEFGLDGDVYFTDGPCAFQGKDDRLYIIWSSWSKGGYGVGWAYSDNGRLDGNWIPCEIPLFPENGGHGMAFQNLQGEWLYALHYPNDANKEHPVFTKLTEENGVLRIAPV